MEQTWGALTGGKQIFFGVLVIDELLDSGGKEEVFLLKTDIKNAYDHRQFLIWVTEKMGFREKYNWILRCISSVHFLV